MRAWQANLVGVGVAGLVVGSGLVLGASDAVANGPTSPMTLNAPRSLDTSQSELPIGDSIVLAGRPAKLNVFWTSDPSAKIVRSYGDAWDKAGMPAHYEMVDRVSSVSAVDLNTGLMRVVTVIDQGEDRMVLPNITDVRVAPTLSPVGAPVPVPEGARNYVSHTADDATSVSFNANYRAPVSSDLMISFYENELGHDGYAISEPKKALKGGASIEFKRGDLEWISVVATDEPQLEDKNAEKKESSLVIVTHVRSIAPPSGLTP